MSASAFHIILHSLRIATYTTIAVFSLLLFHHPISFASNTGAEVFDIKFAQGKLSVKLENSPLEKVLKEIMAQSGARIWLTDSIDTQVTIEYHDIPIREGIHRILKDKNYAFSYDPNELKEGKISIVSANKSKEIYTPTSKKPLEKLTKRGGKKKKKKEKKDTKFDALAKDALENEDAEKREDAIIELGETEDKKAIEIIAKALETDANEDVRLSAIDALLEIDDDSIVKPLSKAALTDKDPWVRESAVEALGEIESEEAIEIIKKALNDEDGSVREIAQELLDELNE
ncbi:MAG: HEAT repeat domain-containing protein [Candidatus Kuenenia sp.]|nr:HEAT repeat domain-containing protein [Candidatus Kuenenia hertensis]